MTHPNSEDECWCGGVLESQPDEQYGTLWVCAKCKCRYALETIETEAAR